LPNSARYEVRLDATPSVDELAPTWIALHAASGRSFFLSWPWISTWLTALPAAFRPQLLSIHLDNRLIAMALIAKQNVRRHVLLNSRTWALNVTARPEFDSIFIEHNDLLVHKENRSVAWSAWASSLADGSREWDEIKLNGVSPDVVEVWRTARFRVQEDMCLTSRYVALDDVRHGSSDYISSLGKNTRARIRSTQRAFENKFGPVRLVLARDRREALQFYADLKTLHQETWIARGSKGAFANRFLDAFHSSLIANHFDDGVIQLARVYAGTHTLGLLYNFVQSGAVSMYQCGFDYSVVDSPNKQSPGMLVHALLIQHCIDLGLERYDFLAGDNQYKRVLANRSEQLWWGRVQQDALKFKLEDCARAIWRLRHRLSGTPVGS
jgi:CelD/BcsL family acetyltransferase involved in cellulose biosynthesis